MSEDSPGRLQQCTCPNRRSNQAQKQLYWDASSLHLSPHAASPQTCTWRILWLYLEKNSTVNIIFKSQQLNSAFIFLKEEMLIVTFCLLHSFIPGKAQSCLIELPIEMTLQMLGGWKIYLRMQKWMSSGRTRSSPGGSHLCHWRTTKLEHLFLSC